VLTWVILGVCLFLSIVLAGRWFANANPATLAKALKWGILGIVAVVAIFFAVTGRLAFAAPLIAGGVWWLIRRSVRNTLFQAAAGAARAAAGASYGKPSEDGTSEVRTEFLRMELNHNTGAIAGEVLKGKFEGAELVDLSLPEIVELLEVCRSDDPQAVALLESYLDRTEGPDWRERTGQSGSSGESATGSGGMTREEALETLDLQPGATVDEIKEAHHRLMLKMHPDQGGSTYLASKINQAKDFLLGT
jgi:hypothetical protein